MIERQRNARGAAAVVSDKTFWRDRLRHQSFTIGSNMILLENWQLAPVGPAPYVISYDSGSRVGLSVPRHCSHCMAHQFSPTLQLPPLSFYRRNLLLLEGLP